MKQFFTICMAAAMLGTAINADAKISREEAMRLKSEGKAFTMPGRTRDTNALKLLKQAPVSGFHKMIEQKSAQKKAPARVTPLGDEIYGYLGYANDIDTQPIGLYEFEGTAAELKWVEPFFRDNGFKCQNMAKIEDKLVGYVFEESWGIIFRIYYVEYDFETGELLDVKVQDFENEDIPFGYIQTFAYSEKDEKLYGYGATENGYGFVSVPVDDPFNYTLVKEQEGFDTCMSMCYNPVDQNIYGINLRLEFVQLNTETGDQTKVMDLKVPAGLFNTGLCYDPKSSLYYWNINYDDFTSQMATIDTANQKLDIYAEFYNGEEYFNFFCGDEYGVDPNRPERPEVGESEFYKNNLIGIIPFTMPTQTMGGEAIPEDAVLTFKTFVNGEFYNQGTAKAGEQVRASFSVNENGNYAFSMIVIYNGLESKATKLTTWIGDDEPVAPTGVKMTTTEVNWNPVTESVHNGYLDLKSLYYEVTVNGKTQETTDTSYSISLPENADLAVYNAEVVAVCNGMRSTPSYSNYVPAGTGIPVPVSFMPNPEEYALCVQLDNNEDGECWEFGSDGDFLNPYYVHTNWSDVAAGPMDDWLFLPKITISDVSKFYTFSCDFALRSDWYQNEFVEVLLCNEANPRGVVSVLIDEMTPESSYYETVSTDFRVRQAGDYFIAIHCISDPDQLGINARNFTITDNNITLESPAKPEELILTAAPDRSLKTNVEFTMPTLTMGEVEIDPSTELSVVITTIAEELRFKATPGEAISKEIKTYQGWNEVLVQISKGELNSPALSGKVYTGWDMPSTPQNVQVETTEDMTSMTLTWDPVTTGWLNEEETTEGVINPETVFYNIYIKEGYYWRLYETNIKETTYTYNAEGQQQDYVQLGVMSANEAGANGFVSAVGDIVGEIYDLPIEEDFENGMVYTGPWLTQTLNGPYAATWGIFNNVNYVDNAPKGSSLMCIAAAGTLTRVAVPRFTTAGVSGVNMTLDVLKTNMPEVSVYAEVYGEEAELIKSFGRPELTEDVTKLTVELPAKYMDKTWVAIYIMANVENDGELLAIENLSLTASSAVNAIASESVRIAAGKGIINVAGLNGQDVTVANTNGAIVAKATKANGNATFDVEKGVYVVVAGDKKAKVVVK